MHFGGEPAYELGAFAADLFLLGGGSAVAVGVNSVLSDLSGHPASGNKQTTKQTPKVLQMFMLTSLKPDN